MSGTIALDYEAMMQSLSKVILELDGGVLPTYSDMSQNYGTGVSVTYEFRTKLRERAQMLAGYSQQVIDMLRLHQADIVEVMKKIAEVDVTLADEAKAAIAALDAINTPHVAIGAKVTSNTTSITGIG